MGLWNAGSARYRTDHPQQDWCLVFSRLQGFAGVCLLCSNADPPTIDRFLQKIEQHEIIPTAWRTTSQTHRPRSKCRPQILRWRCRTRTRTPAGKVETSSTPSLLEQRLGLGYLGDEEYRHWDVLLKVPFVDNRGGKPIMINYTQGWLGSAGSLVSRARSLPRSRLCNSPKRLRRPSSRCHRIGHTRPDSTPGRQTDCRGCHQRKRTPL